MLARQDNEDVRSFENHWLNRMERAAERRGKQEGEQEGVQGMQRLLLRLLETRFGSVLVTIRRRVEALNSVGKLTRLADQVLAADSLEALDLDA